MEVAWIVLLELNALRSLARIDGEGLELFEEVLDFLLVVLGNDGCLFGSFLLLSLDFDVAGDEGDRRNLLGGLGNTRFVLLHWDVEHGRVDVGSGLDELSVDWIVEVELKRSRHSLEATPEGLFGFLDNVISGECVEQVSDLMVEDISENRN